MGSLGVGGAWYLLLLVSGIIGVIYFGKLIWDDWKTLRRNRKKYNKE